MRPCRFALQLSEQEIMHADVEIKSSIEDVRSLTGATQRQLALMTKNINDGCADMRVRLEKMEIQVDRVG